MASGRQIAEENVQTFIAWVASKSEADYRAMVSRGVLSRTEIAKECGFAKSALVQNPRIRAIMRDLEDNLRRRGILPIAVERDPESPPTPLTRVRGALRAAEDAERLRRLEQENAALKAEVAELKRAVEKFSVLSDALALSGRLPR